jgi:hypothetical protein
MMDSSFRLPRVAAVLSILLLPCVALYADPGRFDLTGPKIEVRVTRGEATLPIASVPNLQPGDRLWLHPDLPPTQSVHLLLIVAFLRGTTNPPPDTWFSRIETWNKKVNEEGIYVVVPQDAQQAVMFLAPETGGDFSTLKSAVRGRPGIFVRASQDLAEAGFEQARIEKYVAAISQVPPGDAKAMLEHSELLARTLNLKPNDACFKLSVDLQYNCLIQSGNQTLLDDGHGQTVVDALANGPGSDLINQASYTQAFGAGVYSAYVGAIVDLIRLTSGLHTAKYQYIPAIAFPTAEQLNLRLNTAPSFHNPKSVIVIGLPAIKTSIPPPLRPADPKYIACLAKPTMVLQVDGAPLVFSTSLAHDLVLHLNVPPYNDIALAADAYHGGLVIAPASDRKTLPIPAAEDGIVPGPAPERKPGPDPSAAQSPAQPGMITGTIKGQWGFDAFTGPTLQLQNIPGKDWKLDPSAPLIAGHEAHVLLSSTGSACVQSISLEAAPGKTTDAQWKQSDKFNMVDVSVPSKFPDPGAVHFDIHQFGDAHADTVATQTFSEPAKLAELTVHAGDTSATLTGTSLEQVKEMSISGVTYLPSHEAPVAPEYSAVTSASTPSLQLMLPNGANTPKFHGGDKLTARFTLNDGRDLSLPVTVLPERPTVTMLSKRIGRAADSAIQLAGQDDLPVSEPITFSLKSEAPFSRKSSIEVASPDESLHATLSVAAGTLVLQNPHTIQVTLDPLKTFGTSAFGPLRIRAVAPDGTTGNWLPLVTLVRLPTLTSLNCSSDLNAVCTLDGANLYLVDSFAESADFTTPTTIPEGFVGNTVDIPRPIGLAATSPAKAPQPSATLYLRLRDDPAAANIVTLPVQLPTPVRTAPKTATKAAAPTPQALSSQPTAQQQPLLPPQ